MLISIDSHSTIENKAKAILYTQEVSRYEGHYKDLLSLGYIPVINYLHKYYDSTCYHTLMLVDPKIWKSLDSEKVNKLITSISEHSRASVLDTVLDMFDEEVTLRVSKKEVRLLTLKLALTQYRNIKKCNEEDEDNNTDGTSIVKIDPVEFNNWANEVLREQFDRDEIIEAIENNEEKSYEL